MEPDSRHSCRNDKFFQRLNCACAGAQHVDLPHDWKSTPCSAQPVKPWGSLSDAMVLLQAGQIDAGRELLRRLIQWNPSDFDSLYFGYFEHLRPPRDAEGFESVMAHQRAEPYSSSELFSLGAIAGAMSEINKAVLSTHVAAMNSDVKTRFGHFFLLLADLLLSDCYLHSQFFPSKAATHTVANGANTGVAQLVWRQHVRAYETFHNARHDTLSTIDAHERVVRKILSSSERARYSDLLQLLCRIGQGLTLFDAGLTDEARELLNSVFGEARCLEEERVFNDHVNGFLVWTS